MSSLQELFYILPILLALFLGGILGWQRALCGKSAGPRTYALVGAGACLFTILSLNVFVGDIARVAAGVVTGIGFLGAGTILHRKDHVEGLTTAAGMWMTASIGMAIGSGYYLLSIAITFIVLLLLMVDDRRLKGKGE